MHTLFDFISHVNGMQYVIALCSVAGFALFVELLSPRPFLGLISAIAEDIRHIKAEGSVKIYALARNGAVALGCAAMYAASLPILFASGMLANLGETFEAVNPTGWNPVRAYFVKRRKTTKTDNKDEAGK